MIQHIPETVIFQRSDVLFTASLIGVGPTEAIIFQSNSHTNLQCKNGLYKALKKIYDYTKKLWEKIF